LVSVDPGCGRKLLRDLAEGSQSIGFPPHGTFAAVERIFGDVSADASEADFQFGSNGKPLYIPGPFDSASLIRAADRTAAEASRRRRFRIRDGGLRLIQCCRRVRSTPRAHGSRTRCSAPWGSTAEPGPLETLVPVTIR